MNPGPAVPETVRGRRVMWSVLVPLRPGAASVPPDLSNVRCGATRSTPFSADVRHDWPVGQGRVIRLTVWAAFVAMTAALLAVAALATVTPGQWSGATPGDSKTRARVVFDVTPGSGLIQPYVRIDLPRCRSTRTLHLHLIVGPVSARGGRFLVRERVSPPARSMKVRLRVAGRFVSSKTARGVVRGRVRYTGGHVCRIPRLPFVAHPAGAAHDDPVNADDDTAEDLGDAIIDDDVDEFDDEFDDGDYEEDDEGDDGP
jgi:hypothetical protein